MGGGRDSGELALTYLVPRGGVRHRRGTKAPPCPGVRGGDQRLRQETHKPVRSGLESPDPKYYSEPGTNPLLPCPPPARPGLACPRASLGSTSGHS